MYPQRQPRQLHGDVVDVHAVDAPPGNLPPEQLDVLDFDAVDGTARLLDAVERRFAKPQQFAHHAGQRSLGEVAAEAPFDAVHGRHQEVPGTHRNVGHAEVEERLGGPAVVQLVEPGQVVGNRRLQGVVEQVLDGKALGVVAARGLARAAGVVQVDLALANVGFFLPAGT